MDNRPIGVFDSGVGGLTVVKALRQTLPGEDIIYLGDTARVPYGTKARSTVTRFSIECVQFLLKFNIKQAVVACNTASSCAVETLKKRFDVPVMGVIEPGARDAVKISSSKNKKIAVIATRSTVKSNAYQKHIHKLDKSVMVLQQPCPLFVPFVEENMIKGAIIESVVKEYLKAIKSKNVDSIILGCTHYPLLKSIIAKYLKGVHIIDSSKSISIEIKRTLEKKQMLSNKKQGILKCFVTDDANNFKTMALMFLDKDISIKRVQI
ncbi:MAG: glutamate racemase [Candidatus Omnitrophica bacterium]|nr:glutamate racemase [Candidatus Omnitrophota bacterium]